LHGSESEVLCVGRELDVKNSGAVIEGLDGKLPGLGDGTEERAKVSFKHPSTECRKTGGLLNGIIELVCTIHASLAQLSHHLRESSVRNRLYETTVPKPILGRAYLECAMDRVTTADIDDGVIQIFGL
jgi:hypothetical protein